MIPGEKAPPDALSAVLERARQQGHLGPGPIERQIDHALGFVDAAERCLSHPPGKVVDLGTGGGVPGLVVALSYLCAQVHLVEVRVARADLLVTALGQLYLTSRVRVDRRRAEVVGRDDTLRGGIDLVTARSFGPPAVVAECAAPLLRVGGLLVVSEPPTSSSALESRWPTDGLAEVGLERIRVPGAGGARVARTAENFVVMRSVAECSDRWPRRTGVPERRPLWSSPPTSAARSGDHPEKHVDGRSVAEGG